MLNGFDSGPPSAWASLFAQAPLDAYIAHSSGRFRTPFGPVWYRGRLDGTARVLLVGQDPSTDEILAQRIFVGSAGQRVQELLRKLGVTQSYLLLNTFLFSVFGQYDSQLRAIAREPVLANYRHALFDHVLSSSPITAIITFGVGAKEAVSRWSRPSGPPTIALRHPTAPSGVTADWNSHLAVLHAAISADAGANADLTPYGTTFTDADLAPIPRADLPFGIPDWHGQGGTRSTRQGTTNQIIWTAPE